MTDIFKKKKRNIFVENSMKDYRLWKEVFSCNSFLV